MNEKSLLTEDVISTLNNPHKESQLSILFGIAIGNSEARNIKVSEAMEDVVKTYLGYFTKNAPLLKNIISDLQHRSVKLK